MSSSQPLFRNLELPRTSPKLSPTLLQRLENPHEYFTLFLLCKFSRLAGTPYQCTMQRCAGSANYQVDNIKALPTGAYLLFLVLDYSVCSDASTNTPASTRAVSTRRIWIHRNRRLGPSRSCPPRTPRPCPAPCRSRLPSRGGDPMYPVLDAPRRPPYGRARLGAGLQHEIAALWRCVRVAPRRPPYAAVRRRQFGQRPPQKRIRA